MSECMTQEDAMNMNAEQAIQILKPLQMMMRDRNGCPISDAYFALEKAIEALEQKADAVSVVRCKDCKHATEYSDKQFTCKWFDTLVLPDDFCSNGKRSFSRY